MQYMIAIYPTAEQANDPADAADSPAWAAYTQALIAAGVMRGGEELGPPHTATTLRFGGATPEILDGPFAETKEMLGGFYLIEVPDLDAALHWAARVPMRPGGKVELRPVAEQTAAGQTAAGQG